MQEHEYRARDKTVKKMSRDGLKEENLHSRKSIRVSNRETDDFFCATQAEDMEDFSKRGERAEDTKSAKKKLYSEKAGRTEAAETVGQDMEESGKKRAASRKNADTGIGECQMAGRNRGSRQQYRGTFV